MDLDGFKIYAQPALPAVTRFAQLSRDQQRYKNSKKKCNLFVKGFPSHFNEENLRELFQPFGEIESIKIFPSTDNVPTSRAFVCYKTPDSASNARIGRHNYNIDGKLLYVTNYELPEVRRKQQAEAKDRADFFNSRSATQQSIDPSILQRPDTIQLIQQILVYLQRSFNPRQMNNSNYQRPGGNNGGNYRQGPNGNRMNQQPGAPGGYNNRGPRGPINQTVPQAMPPMSAPQAAFQQVAAPQVVINTAGMEGPSAPLPNIDPMIANYNQKGFSLLPAIVPENPNIKRFVGEFIYEYVEKFVGEERAPKITGMLIDLPLPEIKGYLFDFTKLYGKIGEAVAILSQLAAQGQ